MNRRAALRFAVLTPATLLLAACPGGLTTSQIASYATAAENAAADVLAAITPTANIPAPTLAQINGYLADVKAAAAALAASAPAAGASFEQALYDGIKAVLPIAAPLLSTIPGVGLGLAALQAILPVVAGWLGLTGAPAQAPATVPPIPTMNAAQALKLYGP